MINNQPIKAVIFGCSGPRLTDEEKAFFKKANPLGLILFDRNIDNPAQVKALTAEFRETVGRVDAPILVDQEGGRVTRLWPPYWTGLGWNKIYGDWYREDPQKGLSGVQKHAEILASDLLPVGIDVDCWPCLDTAMPQTHEIMLKRCFSNDPKIVAALAETAVETALMHGLMPVIKHIPGYGRTQVDPHVGLPIVKETLNELEKTDFLPFSRIKQPVWGMTAHVIYTALDAELPATLSKKVLDYVRTNLKFDGFLICDDITMGALKTYGSLEYLSLEMIKAGCDCVLHCNGRMNEMNEIAAAIPALSDGALVRLNKAQGLRHA